MTEPTPTPEEQAEVDRIYETLKPEAVAAARSYVLARTPVNLQVAMEAKIAADFPPPAPVEPPVADPAVAPQPVA